VGGDAEGLVQVLDLNCGGHGAVCGGQLVVVG
jgi:hypothetical protein